MKQKIAVHITSTCECGHESTEILHIADADFSIASSPPVSFDTLKTPLKGSPTIKFTGHVSKVDITGIQTKRDPVFHLVCPRCGEDLLFATQEEQNER